MERRVSERPCTVWSIFHHRAEELAGCRRRKNRVWCRGTGSAVATPTKSTLPKAWGLNRTLQVALLRDASVDVIHLLCMHDRRITVKENFILPT